MSTHYTTNEMENNGSGQGPHSRVPEEVKGWCWGGFLWGFIWAIGNKTWIGLLGLFPIANIIMPFVLGIKGREWAWQNSTWRSVDHFRTVQKRWVYWWLGVNGVIFILGAVVVYKLVLPSYQLLQSAQAAMIEQNMSQQQMNTLSQLSESVPLSPGDRIARKPQINNSGTSVNSVSQPDAEAVKQSSIETIIYLKSDSGNRKLLKAAIGFKYDDVKYPRLGNEIRQRRTQLYNIFYKQLSSLSVRQVTGARAEDHIRSELCTAMNAVLPSGSGSIGEVVFTEFTVE